MSFGTDAIAISLRALAINTKGREYFDTTDEIITTSFTFTATGDAVLRAGATPVFIDIEPDTYNVDCSKIRKYLSNQSKNKVVGILPVHLYGQACNMDEIAKIAKDYDLFIVEDVAQAFGGKWHDKKLGSIGDAGTFSFFPSKNLGGFGDGGMIATNNGQIADTSRMLLKHGGKDKYNVSHIGYNSRLDTIQAAILLAKFKYIDEFNSKRRKIAEFYHSNLSGIPELRLPSALSETYHVYHQYTVRISNDKRENVQKELSREGISTAIYYPFPLHKMKVFQDRAKTVDQLKQAEIASKEVLSLPIEPLLTEETQMRICERVKEALKKC